MRCLFLDTLNYAAEKLGKNEIEKMQDCLVVLAAFENGDRERQIKQLIKEINKVAQEYKTRNIVFAPFCHLSANLMPAEDAQKMVAECERRLANFNLLVSEFGVEKGLLLNIRPSAKNIKFREF